MGILSIMAALKSEFLFQDFSLMSVASYLLLTAIFAVILLIAMYDLRHFIIPDSFLVSFFVLSFLYLSIFPSFNFSFAVSSLLSAIILALPFLLIFLVSKGTWFGFGDVKYILILSFFLGFGQGLSAIILSFWIGAAFSLAALSFKRIAPHINLPLFKNSLTMKSEIPFGPFLSIGIIISFYFNADLFQIHSFFSTL
jgi:Flp pilus assembly protein protease CpaA